LKIGGDGALRTALEDLVSNLGVREQVHFLGRLGRQQVLAEMQAADAFVMASHYETFCVVLIEALSCGLPVVGTACGGPECIIHEQNGILVPPRNVPAMAAAVSFMRRNAHQYDRAGIRRDCVERFGQKSLSDRLARLYGKMLNVR
jgi:L-malate glycosyltransferase